MRTKRTTKVILLDDVYNQGVAGEVIDVAPGFARNFLIPQGLALMATPGSMSAMQNLREHSEMRRAERDQRYSAIAEKIEALKLYYPVKAGETGKLYGSVTSAMIAETLLEEIEFEVDRRRIGDRPLRELGEFQVPVRLDGGVTAQVSVVVFREGEDPRDMTAEELAEWTEATQEAQETEEEEYLDEAVEEVVVAEEDGEEVEAAVEEETAAEEEAE